MFSSLLSIGAVADEPTSCCEPAEAETARNIVETLEVVLKDLDATTACIPRFAEACDEMLMAGRCERLRDHMKRLSLSPSVDIFEADLRQFQVLLQDLQAFLKSINEAKMAPPNCWDRWLKLGGKYARRMARLNNQLNDRIADHVLHVNVRVPDAEVAPLFPPSVEEMELSLPSGIEEEQPLSTLKKIRSFDSVGGNRRSSVSSHHSLPLITDTNSSLRSCRSTRSTLSSPLAHCPPSPGGPLFQHLNPTIVGKEAIGDNSLRSMQSTSVTVTSADDFYNTSSTVLTEDTHGSGSSSSSSNFPKLAWDLSPRTVKQDKWWGSSSNVCKSRKDKNELYVKTQVLREMPQDMPVKELRVVLAQLERGDTSPAIMAGRSAMMAIGALGALMVSPLVVMGGMSAKEAVTQTPLEAAAVFSHYLIEFELENGTIGTLENCVEDIYLYAGKSSRHQQHTVARVPLVPGLLGSPDSLTQPVLLQDLIRFRNDQRLIPYRLWDNNCKHFVYLALTNGQLFPKASNYEEDSLDVFFALCQGCYVQQDCFNVFSESHEGGENPIDMAKQIMTLWEQETQGSEEASVEGDVKEEEKKEEDAVNETSVILGPPKKIVLDLSLEDSVASLPLVVDTGNPQ